MNEYICKRVQVSDGVWAVERSETEIVRCRDCKYAHDVTWPAWSNIPYDYLDCYGELVELWDYHNDEPKMNPVKPDGFCAWGERRGDAE